MHGLVLAAVLAGGFLLLRKCRRHYGHHFHGCHYGWHHHGPDHHGGRWFRGGWFLDRILRDIDASPDQTRVIRDELASLFDEARELRKEAGASRDDVARVLRSDTVDENVLADVFTRHDDRLRDVRKHFVEALARVHDVLDERQRKRLAELIERGPGLRWGPYRGG